eukprot:GHVQ01009742.1.p1 GENE.GHVQ01009742.1~~GHVQ01009742.1.p1  ORF type:complete len:133 (+),score=22.14 GHVQ01009742.1:258-656(+)
MNEPLPLVVVPTVTFYLFLYLVLLILSTSPHHQLSQLSFFFLSPLPPLVSLSLICKAQSVVIRSPSVRVYGMYRGYSHTSIVNSTSTPFAQIHALKHHRPAFLSLRSSPFSSLCVWRGACCEGGMFCRVNVL